MRRIHLFLSVVTLHLLCACSNSHDGTYVGWNPHDTRGSLKYVVSGDRYISEGDGYVNKGTIRGNKWLYDDCGICVGHFEGNTIRTSGITLKKQ